MARDTLEIVQGRYVADLVWLLHSQGVLERLAEWQTPEDVAAVHAWNADLLATILAFLRQTTDLLQKDARGRYRVRARYRAYAQLGFYLDFFIGAYGKSLSGSAETLRQGFGENAAPDGKALARAFAGIADAGGDSVAFKVLRSLGVGQLLDLGSGAGALLGRLAQADPQFLGWGIDQSADMCRSARARLKNAGATHRVKVICGDVRAVGRLLGAKSRQRVEAVHAGGLMNSFFDSGTEAAIDFIRLLARLFPGRALLIDDYYSKVHDAAGADYRLSVLHDMTQALSGQGLPPRCLAEWERIYDSAGIKLVRSYQGDYQGLAWFHHVLQM